MEIHAVRKGQSLTVSLKGELDHHSAAIVREKVDAILSDTRIKELIFDMKGVTFMDSSGVGVILGRYRLMASRSGTMGLKDVSASVDRVLKMAGIYSLIKRVGA